LAQRNDNSNGQAAANASRTDGNSTSMVRQGPQAATFKLIYESRDGKLCLFEDAEGHLTAVNSKRLA